MKHIYFLISLLLSIPFFAQPSTVSPIMPITSSIAYQGFGESIAHLGTGEYQIYYDNVDGILDKPIFFIDGFDPGNSRTIPLMYELLNFGNPIQNLGELVRNEGYDLIVLNFPSYTSSSDGFTVIDGGGDFIQRNAFILVELINTINQLKMGSEQNVVIGPSMGGLISRYALRYMEQNGLSHDTRLYISFDSPHLGANVPIGLQYLFNYLLNGDPAVTDAEFLVNGLLNSPAAKQMLVDHFSAHLANGSVFEQNSALTEPIGAINFRDAFQSELDAMGFPQNTRNIAVTNGSGFAEMTGAPGMELINHTFDTGFQNGLFTRATMAVNFVPLADETISVCDFVGEFFLIVWIEAYSYNALAKSPVTTDGIDSAPGGQFDLFSFDDGTNPLITEFVANLTSQYFNFIPTLSGLAINNSNWYSIPNTGNSPFDSVYIPEHNEPHVTLTEGNVAFALDEIYGGTLSNDNIALNSLKLMRNPVSSSLTLISTNAIDSANISIIDMMGKRVYNSKTSLDKYTTVPIDLSKGIYILAVEDVNSSSYFKTKLVVK